MVALEVFAGMAVAFAVLCSVVQRWNEVRYRKAGLPPGTMGWPVVGKTTEFLKQGPSFMRIQSARYGSLFKLHILGCPTVVCMDPELNRSILMNEGQGFLPGYPKSLLDILGKHNIAAVDGSLHKSMRRAIFSLINNSMIEDQLLGKVDDSIRLNLSNWDEKIVDIQEKTKEIWLLSILNLIAGIKPGPLFNTFKSEISKLVLGTLSLPIKFPGTNYHDGLKARKKIVSMLREITEQRRSSTCSQNDMLDSLLNDEAKSKLNDEEIIDLIISLIYSGYETVATTSMMSVKLIHDHPKVLEELRNEHLEIRKRKSPEAAVDWNDYKSMSFTRAVIFETLRFATVVNGVLRKIAKDMELKGFTIPKDWRIYVYMREINYDPLLYPEPLAFNPWRWLDKSMESRQYFMAFGGGSRLCPGKELGLVQIATFLHYLVTKYRWEEIGQAKISTFPRIEAPNGLHMQVWNRSKVDQVPSEMQQCFHHPELNT